MPGIYDLLTRPRVCSASELSEQWTLPTAELGILVDWEPCRFLPPPSTVFVEPWDRPRTAHRSVPAAIGDYPIRVAQGERPDGSVDYVCMEARDLLTGMVVAAPPGSGKSHFAKVLFGELERVGAGVAVTDFKGDLVTDILSGLIPRAREGETRVFDLADEAWLPAINPIHHPRLDMRRPAERGRVTDAMMGLIGRLDPSFEDGPGMQEFCRNATLAVLEGEERPNPLQLHRFMLSEAYRARVLSKVDDSLVREFWEDDFPRRSEAQKSSVDALVRRLGLFLMQPAIRHMVCRDTTTVDFRQAMDTGQIVLASLPVEVIGVQVGTFAAQTLQALLTNAGFSRTIDRIPEHERRLFVNLIDEFHQAITSTDARDVESQLARMRGMGVANVYLYQSAAQLPPDLRDQLESIVASYVCLGAFGSDVAALLRRWPQLESSDLLGMRRRLDAYMQLQVHEEKTAPFRGKPLPLWPMLEQPPLGQAPADDWRVIQAPATEPWHPWMDERCRALSEYERAATAERDEARGARSQAALIRRGDLAAAERNRDSWERSREAWPQDAQTLLVRAAAAEGRAVAHERAPLTLLRDAQAEVFECFCTRMDEHRAAQRRYILEYPAAIPDTRLRIVTLSRLEIAKPVVEVAAAVARTLAAMRIQRPAPTGRASRDEGRGTVGASDGRLRALAPLPADARSDLEVVETALPVFEGISGMLDRVAVMDPL